MRPNGSSLLLAVVLIAGVPSGVSAQDPAPDRFGITDNSFLVEEAFNQEPGIFQNIFVMTRSRDGVYDGSLTQEWPVVSMRQQLSFTMPFSAASGQGGAVGDLMVNYRFQVWDGDGTAPAFSPRVSLIVPTSAPRRPMGADGVGWQVNLPFSKVAGPVFFHWNAGATFLPETPAGVDGVWANTPFVAGSVIAAVTPMVNPVFETMVEWERIDGVRKGSVTLSPGIRAGWNLGAQQVVIGVAVPVTRGDRRDHAVLGYFSYELPFSRR